MAVELLKNIYAVLLLNTHIRGDPSKCEFTGRKGKHSDDKQLRNTPSTKSVHDDTLLHFIR